MSKLALVPVRAASLLHKIPAQGALGLRILAFRPLVPRSCIPMAPIAVHRSIGAGFGPTLVQTWAALPLHGRTQEEVIVNNLHHAAEILCKNYY